VTAVKSRGCFHYVLTNQQVELLSKISFLERNNKKINTEKLHKCVPILTTLYRIIVRYQKKMKKECNNPIAKKGDRGQNSNPVADCNAVTEAKPIQEKEVADKNTVTIQPILKETEVADISTVTIKFPKYEYKSKEIRELEKELQECDDIISGVSTECHSVYDKKIEAKARAYDELIQRREEKRNKKKKQMQQKLKLARNKAERKKMLKEYFMVAKNEINTAKVEGFEYSIKSQSTKYGLAGYLSVTTNKKYMNQNTNLATKQEIRERMMQYEKNMDQEEKELLQLFREGKKDKRVIDLVQEIQSIREQNREALIESNSRIKEERMLWEQSKQRYYMLGGRPFNEYDFDLLDKKAKERLEPYLRLITQRTANNILKEKEEYENAQKLAFEKQIEEDYKTEFEMPDS
jgi:hypothetical protein